MTKLTHSQVRNIFGDLDDLRVAQIIATEATQAELLEAKTWLYGDDYMGGDLGRSASGRIARIIEILKADEPEWGEET